MNSKIDAKKIEDNFQMGQAILDFHKQIRTSIAKLSAYPKIRDSVKINKIVVFGMGGSAIAGDLARNFISVNHPEIEIPITIVRNYNVPVWVDSDTLVIAVSYSGNTEETLSGLARASVKSNHVIGISSGGTLREICKEKNYPFVEIPGGFQPRAALGYLFTSVLIVLLNNFCRVCTVSKAMIELQHLAEFLEHKGKEYSLINPENNSIRIAEKIYGKIPLFYSSSDILDVVNLRWRGQIQENSKNLAFGNLLPEMNHNEINSFVHPQEMLENIAVFFLSDKSDNPKILDRIEATQKLLSERCYTAEHIHSKEDIFLVRIFDLIYLADWVSYYLAVLNDEDPTPIPLITELKKLMSEK